MIKIYTDGSCWNRQFKNKQGGVGGWCAIITENDSQLDYISGNFLPAKNNQTEIFAVYKALEYSIQKGYEEIDIVADSDYAIDCISIWSPNWEKRNWYSTRHKREILYKDLIKQTYELSKQLKVTWTRIKGHSGIYFNHRADELANEERKRGTRLLIEGGITHGFI